MTQDATQNLTPAQASQTTPIVTPVSVPELTDMRDLHPMLQNTDALEALMKRSAGQLN